MKYFLKLLTAIAVVALLPNSAQAESMHKAVRKAVKTNPDGLAAKASARAVGEDLLSKRSLYLPRISASGEIGANRVDNPSVLSTRDNGDILPSRRVGLAAEFVLFDGFRRSNSIYLNATELDASILNFLATSESLALSAVEVYIDVLRHRNLHHIANRNVRRHEQIAKQIRARVSGGASPVSDMFQANERLQAAIEARAEIELALRNSEDRYKKVVGNRPGKKMHLAKIRGLPKSKQALIYASLEGNYELLTAQKRVKATDYQRKINKSDRFPRLTLNSASNIAADRNGSRGREFDAFVGVRMTWQLYNGGLRKRRDAALEARASEETFKRDSLSRRITEIASRAWNTMVVNRKRVASLRKQMNLNTRLANNYREEFELSKRGLLDVLDAELARFNAQFEKINVEAAINFSKYQMLATQSKLAGFFGIKPTDISAQPVFEERVRSKPRSVFKIDIKPLR